MNTSYIAKCPKTGLHIREATEAERAAYKGQEAKAPFDKPVQVGDVVIDAYTGPGAWHGMAWHGGAGF